MNLFLINVFFFAFWLELKAVSQFSSALQSGQLGPVVSQLAVNPEAVAAASQGNMRDFVRALERSATASTASTASTPASGGDKDETASKSSETTPKKEKDGKKDDDEDMQLD